MKRYVAFTPADLGKAVSAFRANSWATRATKLVVAIQGETADVKLQDAVELHAAELRKGGTALVLPGAEGLAAELKDKPEIVHDFFGWE